jgi:isopentenyl diphosphate isomerase/L-lactate dehydrogenase-like FMN-dependent dehydrogenase
MAQARNVLAIRIGGVMVSPFQLSTSRRRVLQFLIASPVFSQIGRSARAQDATVPSRLPDPLPWAPRDLGKPIGEPKEALSVFDFEPVMKNNVPAAHFGYMATGLDDEVTLRSNRQAFLHYQLRPRRLVDVSKIDTRCEILGAIYDSPIVIAPTGSNRAFHPDGELAVARAARTGNHLQILSTVATVSVEEATAARGAPIWFQLYPTQDWGIGERLVKRAERASCPVIVLTVDVLGPQKWETFVRLRRTDTRECGSCHGVNTYLSRKPNFEGIDLRSTTSTAAANLTWDYVKRLRDSTAAKIVLKGILAPEDAKLAAEIGIDGIIVSNHGGRAEDGGGATIDALPDIVQAAAGRMPILIDSGFRRGTDIVKALALGARAVCIGRPYLWGLGAFGQAGVERVLEILRGETRAAMQQLGAPSLGDLRPSMVRRA